MNRISALMAIGIIGFVWFEILPSRSDTIQEKKTEAVALNMVRQILNDPMLPQSLHNVDLSPKTGGEASEYVAAKNSPLHLHQYDIVPIRGSSSLSVSSCSLWINDNGQFSFLIFLSNDDTRDNLQEPSWEKLSPQWDAFVARHWPAYPRLQRTSDWRKALHDYAPGRGVFPIQYVLSEQDVETMSITLDIRLADGKIGGLLGGSGPAPLKAPIPPRPAKEKMLMAVTQKIPQWQQVHWSSAWQAGRVKKVINLRTLEMHRSYCRLICDETTARDNRLTYAYQMKLLGETEDGMVVTVNAEYDEDPQEANLSRNERPFDIDKFEALRPVARVPVNDERPLTRVVDDLPSWSADGQSLYFNTTRDVKGRPWWQRNSILSSIAVGRLIADKMSPLELIRPVKPLTEDLRSYRNAVPSPTGRYLVAGFGLSKSQLFILDTQRGVLYLPTRSSRWKTDMMHVAGLPSEAYLPQGLNWRSGRVAWLPDETGFLAAMQVDMSGTNIYLVGQDEVNPMQEWNLLPITQDRGDDVLPCLNSQGKLLAWVHKAKQTLQNLQDNKPEEWKFTVADFDAPNAKAINRRSLSLPSEPTSISWDSKGNRWLVVTNTQMLWVQEINGTMEATKIGDLKWGTTGLHPTAAAISLQGNNIAVAATLDTPKVYEKSEARVLSLIFNWDGQRQQVQPFYDPALNGLPRHVFPTSGRTWAKISGNVRKFGLDQTADPTLFVSGPPTVSDAAHR